MVINIRKAEKAEMSSCLILEGGAKRGIYTAGVLDVLLENNIMTDGVIGVSAGAIHGCSYVSGQIGRSIRYNLKYNDDYRFMSFKSFLKTGNMVDTDFAYKELPDTLDVFDHQAFCAASTKFYVTCANLDSGRAEYICCPEMKGKYMDYLRASASMPFVSRIVEVDGKKLLDGGVADSVPLQAALNMGYDKNIVVQTRPEGYRKKPFRLLWLAKMVYSAFPRFIDMLKKRHVMYNAEMAFIERLHQENKIFVIRPSRYIKIRRMETNPEVIKAMYNLGREDAQRALQDLKSFLA